MLYTDRLHASKRVVESPRHRHHGALCVLSGSALFGPPSMTRPQHRTALIAAVREQNGAKAIRLHERAATDFDRKRTEVVGATIKSRPHAMEVTVARNTALAPARIGVAHRSRPTVAAQASAPQTVRQTGTKKPITITARALATIQRHPVQQGRPNAAKHAPRQDSLASVDLLPAGEKRLRRLPRTRRGDKRRPSRSMKVVTAPA